MPLGSEDDFSADDLAILAEHGINADPQAGVGDDANASSEQTGSTEGTETQSTEGTTAAESSTDTTEVKPGSTAQQDEPRGDVKQALRAARRSERQAKAEADRLKAEAEAMRSELEQLRAKQPKGGTDDDIDLDEIAADFPAAAEAIRKERERREAAEQRARELEAAKPAEQKAGPDFTPVEFEPDIQDVIDDVPALLAWQHDPDQTKFQLAIAADGLLQNHPQWRDKPMQERFAEVVRRVNAELSQTTTNPPAASPAAPSKAKEAIRNAPRATPETLSDLGGGQPSSNTSNVERYQRMSDDDIFEDLARGG